MNQQFSRWWHAFHFCRSGFGEATSSATQRRFFDMRFGFEFEYDQGLVVRNSYLLYYCVCVFFRIGVKLQIRWYVEFRPKLPQKNQWLLDFRDATCQLISIFEGEKIGQASFIREVDILAIQGKFVITHKCHLITSQSH